jgi:solute carrier family 13 (sodium-dependent dicarboxylate transporter), member 2/3/5
MLDQVPGANSSQAAGIDQAVSSPPIHRAVGGKEPIHSCKRISVGQILAIVVPLMLWIAPLNMDPTAKRALAIASFMIIAWITEALEYFLTGFIGCYLFWALGIVKFETAFSGFASESPFFVLGALLIGMMVTQSGLGNRLAYMIIVRIGTTYSRILLGFVLVSFLLTLVVPSGSACLIIKATVALGLMKALGLSPGSNIGRGIFLVLTYTSSLFNKMVIGGSSAILVRGFLERMTHLEVLWSRWFLAFLPCTVLTVLATWRLGLWLFPPERDLAAEGKVFFREEIKKMGPWSPSEKRAAILMLLAIGLWMADFIHHLSPAMVGLGVGLAAALPGVGVLQPKDLKRLNYAAVFFVAAELSLGDVLVKTQAIDVLSKAMFDWMGALITNSYSLAVVTYWTAFIYHFFLGSEVVMLSTSVPALINLAQIRGLDPLSLSMIWTFAGASKIFVYQSSVMILGYAYGYFDSRDLLRFGACMTVVEFLILLLIVTQYWPLIGIG